ncbi:hypothetical protein HHI36_004956 [Cryptolaemus montrouzieri]|uniref:Uncharacterized protein n=1 Tax=Cryptolaemus montrouzieri TaxID=559131 RepID=A0ABD2NSQ2_9CUCU
MTGGSCCEDEGDEVCEMVKTVFTKTKSKIRMFGFKLILWDHLYLFTLLQVRAVKDIGDAVFGDDEGICFAGDLSTDAEEDIGMVCEEDCFQSFSIFRIIQNEWKRKWTKKKGF